ncbi:hypothetical protein IWQ61_000721 [Dispira simplex]|nr:hypothetical protein IWQ61_000721 [Dispira simplex]
MAHRYSLLHNSCYRLNYPCQSWPLVEHGPHVNRILPALRIGNRNVHCTPSTGLPAALINRRYQFKTPGNPCIGKSIPVLHRSFAIFSPCYKDKTDPKTSPPLETPDPSPQLAPSGQTIGKTPPKLFLRFTCKVCNNQNQKLISKQAYTEGVVLVQCDHCQNRHLIADNMGWFRDSSVNLEDLMKEKGEIVRRQVDTPNELQGVLEWLDQEKRK